MDNTITWNNKKNYGYVGAVSPHHWVTDQEHKHTCSAKQCISINGECTVNLSHFTLVNKETQFK